MWGGGGGGPRGGSCGGYPLLLSSLPLASLAIGVIIIPSTYSLGDFMDKLKTFIGSLIFMVPMLVLMLAYFDVLVK